MLLTRTAVFSIIHYNSDTIFVFVTCHLSFIMDHIPRLIIEILGIHSFYFSKLIQLYIKGHAPLYSHFMGTIYSSDRINLIKSQFKMLQQFTVNKQSTELPTDCSHCANRYAHLYGESGLTVCFDSSQTCRRQISSKEKFWIIKFLDG